MLSPILLAALLLQPVRGHVNDASTGAPVAGAEIMLYSAQSPLRADAAGDFSLQAEPGDTLTIAHDGYVSARLVVRAGVSDYTVPLLRTAVQLDALAAVATRASADAPVAASTLAGADLERAHVGEDVTTLLASTPATTMAFDAGVPAGYGYWRLRGMDQTRIAITLDGVPLNDPEDQVLYFSNFPDFTNSLAVVQVQRGVGTSAFGTAGYAGAVHFESVAAAAQPRGGELQLGAGSYGTRRGSLELTTGMLPHGFAFHARGSGQRTDGFRDHAFNRSASGYLTGGWFGSRDQVRLTAFTGRARNGMAYLAASEADLSVSQRSNPLGADESDDFRQQFLSLRYTHALTPGIAWTTTAWHQRAGGDYDVRIDSLWNFNLRHHWTGALSVLRASGRAGTLELGGSANTYQREHYLFIRPDLSQRVYDNFGHRAEQSAFARGSRALGRWSVLADAQLRRSSFSYTPDPANGAALGDVSWTFFNPRGGLTYQPAEGWSLYGFYGRTTREPTRNDLFAGFDDVGQQEAAFIGSLRRVKPETVHDLEAGASWQAAAFAARANLFSMRFRNEIAAIGELSYIGLPLRKNVPRSSRQGLELEARAGREGARLQGGGNLSLLRARIAEYTDDASGVTYTDVHPLLTPPVIAHAWGELRPMARLRVGAEAQYTTAAYLANDDDRRFMTPAALVLNAHAGVAARRSELLLELENLTSAHAYTSGYSDGSSRYFFPVAPLHLMLTLRQSL